MTPLSTDPYMKQMHKYKNKILLVGSRISDMTFSFVKSKIHKYLDFSKESRAVYLV